MSVDLVDRNIAILNLVREIDAVPGDWDLYVYLNIKMAIVRLHWVSFAAMPSRTLKPLSVVTVGSMSGMFCHSVVGVRLGCHVPCCSSLDCMLSVFCMVLFTYTINQLCMVLFTSLCNFVFSYDIVLFLSQKRYCLVRLFLRATHT